MSFGFYIMVALMLWPVFAWVLFRGISWNNYVSENEKYGISTGSGLVAGLVWPLMLPAVLVMGMLKFFAERGK